MQHIWRTISSGNTWRGELKNKAKDGTVYWVDTTIIPFLNEKGKPYQYVAIRADITRRKMADDEIKMLNEGLEKSVNERTAELMVANKELGQFAYIASHDLQEPLRTVSNYMQVIEEDYADTLDANAHRYIQSVKKATGRMSALIKSLLEFSRLGYHKVLNFADCNKLIEEVVADLKASIQEYGAVVNVAKMPSINLYESEIRQLFQNLISNAVKFHRAGIAPVVNITCIKINNSWQFAVSDDGIGIEPVYFNRIFDIFQRLKTDTDHQGSGIGLANCKKIVHLHQGNIWLESTPGQGTTFFFTLSNLLK